MLLYKDYIFGCTTIHILSTQISTTQILKKKKIKGWQLKSYSYLKK